MDPDYHLVNLNSQERLGSKGARNPDMPVVEGEEIAILLMKAKPPSDDLLGSAHKAGSMHLNPDSKSAHFSIRATSEDLTESLPIDVMRNIATSLAEDEDHLGGLLSFGLTCRSAFAEAKTSFKAAITRCSGRWARQRLVLIGEWHEFDDKPRNLHLTDADVRRLESPTIQGVPAHVLPGYATHYHEMMEPLAMAEPASDAVFLDIHRLSSSGAVSQQTAQQMLAMAYPTWHLLLPTSEDQDYALCLFHRNEYLVCSDLMRAYDRRAAKLSAENSYQRAEGPDEASICLESSKRNRALKSLAMVGRCILMHLRATDTPHAMRGSLAGVPMEIVPLTPALAESGLKRVHPGGVFNGTARYLARKNPDCAEWRYPPATACQEHKCLLQPVSEVPNSVGDRKLWETHRKQVDERELKACVECTRSGIGMRCMTEQERDERLALGGLGPRRERSCED